MTTTRFEAVVLLLAGLFFLLPGIWAFVAPHAFYDQLATFPPYNRHLLHDIGCGKAGQTCVFWPPRPICPMTEPASEHVRFPAMGHDIRHGRMIVRMPIRPEEKIP